jgi:hypothetical protein
MGHVILASVVLGIVWNAVAVSLMGGRVADAFAPAWLLAGALAGVAVGVFTVWSRRRRDGRESVVGGIAAYYLGMFVYWAAFVVIQRAIMCVQHGGWTDFDLPDHLGLMLIFLMYGTVWFGVVLIPLCFLSRYLVWTIYTRSAV